MQARIEESNLAKLCAHQKWHKWLMVNDTIHGRREPGMTPTRSFAFNDMLYDAVAPLGYHLLDTSALTAARCVYVCVCVCVCVSCGGEVDANAELGGNAQRLCKSTTHGNHASLLLPGLPDFVWSDHCSLIAGAWRPNLGCGSGESGISRKQ